MSTLKQVTKKLANCYRLGSKRSKSQILDELVELKDGTATTPGQPCTKRSNSPNHVWYAPDGNSQTPADLQPGLVLRWAALRASDSKLLVASMPYLVPKLRAEKALGVTDAQAQKLTKISASTIDRRLAN